MRILTIFLIALLSALDSIRGDDDYVEFALLVDILENTNNEGGMYPCDSLVHEINENSLGLELTYDNIGLYLMMGKESSLYAQRLRYLRIFVECLEQFGHSTMPFEYYALIIVTEPVKRLEEYDLMMSQAISSISGNSDIPYFIPKQLVQRIYHMNVWFSVPSQCQLFAVTIKSSMFSGRLDAISDDEVAVIISKAKDTALHSRDSDLITFLVGCLRSYGQKTLPGRYYQHLRDDINEILPENLFDIYGGILDYDDEDPEDIEDFPTVTDILAGISVFQETLIMRCLHMAVEIFKLVHPGEPFFIENPGIYDRLIKMLKYGRAAMRKAHLRRNEHIFRDCIVDLESMRDIITNVDINRVSIDYADDDNHDDDDDDD